MEGENAVSRGTGCDRVSCDRPADVNTGWVVGRRGDGKQGPNSGGLALLRKGLAGDREHDPREVFSFTYFTY